MHHFFLLPCLFSFADAQQTMLKKIIAKTSQPDTGEIVFMNKIKIKSAANIFSTELIIGCVGGGLVGSILGPKTNMTLSTIAGSVLGSAIGNFVKSKKTDGIEYTIQLQNKSILTISQGIEPELSVGQKVFVIHQENGGSIVVPA